MTNVCKLIFEVECNVHDECADDLGKDLAIFLLESFLNGEDVIDVKYKGHKVIL